ncbi:COX15/CtaA family protein [Microvirga sp. W0021]|uniref:Heme A synthase n=1 Tax=Hohaiivirga grylli TaxID=3133970 RepID=A0ABV0BI64_9HYPH
MDALNSSYSRKQLSAPPWSAPSWGKSWIWLLIICVIIMVAIGGATRLTGSGLSITEWKPLTGAIPPLSESSWLSEFEKYRQSPQYELLNTGMSLAEFKSIYWWEWGHRQFGRLMGLVFVIPFLVLVFGWFRKQVSGWLILGLVGLCLLGALQAMVGWIMVASGLKPGMIAVAPVKLMLHLIVATLILASLTFIAQRLSQSQNISSPKCIRWGAWLIFLMVFVQIALGALVAGSKAGLTYNTWPLMDGDFIPPAKYLFMTSPWYENFFDNVTMVQFQHRMFAYCVVIVAGIYSVFVNIRMPATPTARRALLVAGLILVQAALGILTLLLAVPLWAGLAHQILAMLVLVACAYHTFSLQIKRSSVL